MANENKVYAVYRVSSDPANRLKYVMRVSPNFRSEKTAYEWRQIIDKKVLGNLMVLPSESRQFKAGKSYVYRT